jgi:hypothetical protein
MGPSRQVTLTLEGVCVWQVGRIRCDLNLRNPTSLMPPLESLAPSSTDHYDADLHMLSAFWKFYARTGIRFGKYA